MITLERAKQMLHYDRQTGHVYWISKPGQVVSVGNRVGWQKTNGAISAMLDGHTYALHNLVWLLETGAFPEKTLLHLDGDKSNNRFENLATRPAIAGESDIEKKFHLVQRFLSYDIESGFFTWKTNFMGNKSGDQAGYIASHGYRVIGIFGAKIYAHRLAFMFATGSFPRLNVDHIDGNRLNNRWSNLRDVDQSTNAQNKRAIQPSNKSSGLLGVYFHKQSSKYCATIKILGKKQHLGLFDTAELAHQAYLASKRSLHKGCTI